MAPYIIKLDEADDLRDVIHHTVEAIASGKVVAIPTESGFGLAASALSPSAVERLVAAAASFQEVPIAYAVKSLDDALDYVPNMTPNARRIARRCWPGPVTLVLDDSHPDSVVQRLDPQVKHATVVNETISLRAPSNEVTRQLLRLCAGPVILAEAKSSDNVGNENEYVVESAANLGDGIDLALDGGRADTGLSTVVRVLNSGKIKVIREGSVDADTVVRLANFVGLVVCTGNTCRSPMAEALFKKMVAEKVGCDADQLIEKGIQIASAGIAAMPGAPAAEQAIEVMRNLGMEIGDHASQPVSDRTAQAADLILTMTGGHRHALISHWPMLEPRTKTLRVDGGDISDPIGSPVSVYESCARQIEQNLKHWIDQVDWSQFANRE